MACRNPDKGAAARADVIARSGSTRVELMSLDLASFASIRGFAKEALDRFDHIDVLLNNAGAVSRKRVETADGFEQTFGVNHLGHFLLTSLLRDRLVATPGARIVVVASDAHRFRVGGLHFDDLQSTRRYHSVRRRTAAASSRTSCSPASWRAASTAPASPPTAVHPGFVASNFGREGQRSAISR